MSVEERIYNPHALFSLSNLIFAGWGTLDLSQIKPI